MAFNDGQRSNFSGKSRLELALACYLEFVVNVILLKRKRCTMINDSHHLYLYLQKRTKLNKFEIFQYLILFNFYRSSPLTWEKLDRQ